MEGTYPVWKLRLYVAGQTPKTTLVCTNLKAICKEYLAGNCQIEIVDLAKYPQLAKENEIVALPTIIREYPLPRIVLIGDLSNTKCVIARLNLK